MKAQMGTVRFIHQQHRVMGMGNLSNLFYFCRHAEIIGRRQQHRSEIRMRRKRFFHLFRRDLALHAKLFYVRRLHIYRHRVCQNQPAHYTAVGIPGNQYFIARLQRRHQHGMDSARCPVHRIEAGITAV